MEFLTLYISKALLCSAIQCWPVLVGPSTPIGSFTLVKRITSSPGYGGDVLQFHETSSSVYAIHRVWTLRSKEKRIERLKDPNPANRQVTDGCVNIDPLVYNVLTAHYQGATLTIQP